MVTGTMVAGLAVGVVLATASPSHPEHPAMRPLVNSIKTAGSSYQFKASMTQAQADLPELLLPPSQRTAWISGWNQMASCMRIHGIPDFPAAPPTFGDGHTPPPLLGAPPGSLMDVTSSQFQTAQAACPFDTSRLDLQEFKQAWAEWWAEHPSRPAAGPPVVLPAVPAHS